MFIQEDSLISINLKSLNNSKFKVILIGDSNPPITDSQTYPSNINLMSKTDILFWLEFGLIFIM